MRKLKLTELQFSSYEILGREQLKNVLGGSGNDYCDSQNAYTCATTFGDSPEGPSGGIGCGSSATAAEAQLTQWQLDRGFLPEEFVVFCW